jgi:hypothetical protein
VPIAEVLFFRAVADFMTTNAPLAQLAEQLTLNQLPLVG